MGDDSPGKVQALRALFSEKNNPVMGIAPPGGKLGRPWRPNSNSTDDVLSPKDQSATEPAKARVLPFPAIQPNPLKHTHESASVKPAIGPKPAFLLQSRSASSSTSTLSSNDKTPSENERERTFSDSHTKSKVVAETIASFMFTNGHATSNEELGHELTDEVPKLSQSRTNLKNEPELKMTSDILNGGNIPKGNFNGTRSSLINSDNYICKSNCKFRLTELPPTEKLGPAPLKPLRPPHMRLPKWCLPRVRQNSQPDRNSTPVLPEKPIPPKPSYSCPPRPVSSPPLPPVSSSVIKPLEQKNTSLLEEIEELYEDTILSDNHKRPVSLIPEYTQEEEDADNQSEELYHDADVESAYRKHEKQPADLAGYLQPNVCVLTEELYQDASEPIDEEFYEEMPTGPEELEVPIYSNNRKEIEKLRREEEKKLRREQKEKEKKEKEMEKVKRKFGLTGIEIPIDAGLVKADCRGNKYDLQVKRGETVLILRMEGNPSGKWLVKNEKGKIGYVELTNIEVDPDSVKSVMFIRRQSVISASEELYSEAISEEEAIYEVTY